MNEKNNVYYCNHYNVCYNVSVKSCDLETSRLVSCQSLLAGEANILLLVADGFRLKGTLHSKSALIFL